MSVGKKKGSILGRIVFFILILVFLGYCSRSSLDRMSDMQKFVETVDLNKEKYNMFSNDIMRMDTISSHLVDDEITFSYTVLDRTPDKARIDSSKGHLYNKPTMANYLCKLPFTKKGVKYIFHFKATDGSPIETLKMDNYDCLVNTYSKENTSLEQELQKSVAEVNKSLPKMKTDLIRQEKILVDKNQLIYPLTFLGEPSQFKSVDPKKIKQEIVKELCENKYVKVLFDRGAVVDYLVITPNNEELLKFSTSSKDCKI